MLEYTGIMLKKRCLAVLDNGLCQAEQTLVHCFQFCPAICNVNDGMLRILASLLGRVVTAKQLISLSFNHRNKRKLKCAVWFTVKIMYLIFQERSLNKSQFLKSAVKEIDWNLKISRKIGSQAEMTQLKLSINEVIARF